MCVCVLLLKSNRITLFVVTLMKMVTLPITLEENRIRRKILFTYYIPSQSTVPLQAIDMHFLKANHVWNAKVQ